MMNVVTRSLMLLAALVALGGLSGGRAPAVQAGGTGGAGFAVRYQGSLSFGNSPALSGTQITAITARSVTDVTTCAQASVSDNGEFSIDVPAIPLCTMGPQNPQLQGVLFVANHQNVGGAPDLADLSQPATLGRVVSNLHLEGTAMPGPLPTTDFGALGMPAVWYTGQLTLAGTAAPQGTPIAIQALASGNATTSCGRGMVVDEQGDFIASVPATSGCVSQTNGPVVPGYHFYVNGENVGGAPSGDIDLDRPYTLGQVVANVQLSGQQAAQNGPGRTMEGQPCDPTSDPTCGNYTCGDPTPLSGGNEQILQEWLNCNSDTTPAADQFVLDCTNPYPTGLEPQTPDYLAEWQALVSDPDGPCAGQTGAQPAGYSQGQSMPMSAYQQLCLRQYGLQTGIPFQQQVLQRIQQQAQNDPAYVQAQLQIATAQSQVDAAKGTIITKWQQGEEASLVDFGQLSIAQAALVTAQQNAAQNPWVQKINWQQGLIKNLQKMLDDVNAQLQRYPPCPNGS